MLNQEQLATTQGQTTQPYQEYNSPVSGKPQAVHVILAMCDSEATLVFYQLSPVTLPFISQ